MDKQKHRYCIKKAVVSRSTAYMLLYIPVVSQDSDDSHVEKEVPEEPMECQP